MLLLLGCLDRLLEAPYVLTAGFGEARSLAISREGALLVAGTQGIARISETATATVIGADPVDAIAVNPTHLYALADGVLTVEGVTVPVPGAVDIAASWNPELWVLYPDRIELLATDLTSTRLVSGLAGARAVNLGPQSEMLVTLATEVRAYDAVGASRSIVGGLVDARMAAADESGRVYVVQGSPSELFRVDDGQLTLIARFLDDPRDLQFGRGQLLPRTFAYFATGNGRVDYVVVPL